jgi:hypothetical protein
VLLGRKKADRTASPRSKPLALPSGKVMVHMVVPAVNLKLSKEVRVTAGKSTIVNCNFKSNACTVNISSEPCE